MGPPGWVPWLSAGAGTGTGYTLLEGHAVHGQLLHRCLARTHVSDHLLHLGPLALE